MKKHEEIRQDVFGCIVFAAHSEGNPTGRPSFECMHGGLDYHRVEIMAEMVQELGIKICTKHALHEADIL